MRFLIRLNRAERVISQRVIPNVIRQKKNLAGRQNSALRKCVRIPGIGSRRIRMGIMIRHN